MQNPLAMTGQGGTLAIPSGAATLGFWGVILRLVSMVLGIFLLGFNYIIDIVGTVLLILAYYKTASQWQDASLKKQVVWWSLLTVLFYLSGFIFFVVILGGAILGGSAGLFSGDSVSAIIGALSGLGIGSLVFGLIMLIAFIISVILFYKINAAITEKTGISQFKTGALLYILGILLLVIFVGVILWIISYIMHIIAWNNAKSS